MTDYPFFRLPLHGVRGIAFGSKRPQPGPAPASAEVGRIITVHTAQASGHVE